MSNFNALGNTDGAVVGFPEPTVLPPTFSITLTQSGNDARVAWAAQPGALDYTVYASNVPGMLQPILSTTSLSAVLTGALTEALPIYVQVSARTGARTSIGSMVASIA